MKFSTVENLRSVPSSLICGFMVLRKPEYSFDTEGPVIDPHASARLGDVFYGGTHRLAWMDVDDAIRSGEAPKRCVQLREEINERCNSFSHFPLTPDPQVAEELRCSFPESAGWNEVIAVYSECVKDFLGSFESPAPIDWLGYDVGEFGCWSMVQEGLFLKPWLFGDLVHHINRNGVMDSIDSAIRVAYCCKEAGDRGELEPLTEHDATPVDVVRIGRLMSPSGKP